MKKILTFITLCICIFSFAQFKVAGTSADWNKIGSAYAHTILYQKSDKTKAKIEYRDFGPDLSHVSLDYYTFEFSTEPDTLDKLYAIISDHFKTKTVETMTLGFPEGKMYLDFSKGIGGYYFNFKFDKVNALLDKGDGAQRYSGAMVMKQVDKLFGKTK